jgi:hypothetical protein
LDNNKNVWLKETQTLARQGKMNYYKMIHDFKKPKEKLRYIGPQTFYNARGVNERERYYYGYYGLNYGPQSSIGRSSDYEVLRPSPLACDALTEDCWRGPRLASVPSCDGQSFTESFTGSSNQAAMIFTIGALLGLMALCSK